MLVGREPPAHPAAADRPSAVSVPAATGTFRQPTTVRPLPAKTVRIGRDAGNDLVVSRRHAELRALPDGRHEIVDLGSHNGTFLNGQPVDRAVVEAGDIIGIGHSAFSLVGDVLQEFVDTGEVSLDVQDLEVHVGRSGRGRKTLLDKVSFPVGEKCLLGVVGPSGAGESTLLNALTGLRPADTGTVLYDGRDLYRDFAELRQRIGLVPQDDILHSQLTVRKALGYAAELRFPQAAAKAERQARVSEVIHEPGLEQRVDQPIHSLSGGQRKRVSVALELLTKPSLLFLDEPTSGLDPGMDRSVMHMLRGLADDGRTVIVVTHSVLSLEVCDRLLVLAPGGRIAYYGPPDDALAFFGFEEWPEAVEAFENDRDRDWATTYADSPFHRQYIAGASAQPQLPPAAPGASVAPPPKTRNWGAQLGPARPAAVTTDRAVPAAPEKNRAFASVQKIEPSAVPECLRSLTPVQLRTDTRVTNHGFRDGKAMAYQAVLQAGTAVLVDDRGVPRVRCACGNLLLPPVAQESTPKQTGKAWPGYRASDVVVVEPSSKPVDEFVMVDPENGDWFTRPAGRHRRRGQEDRSARGHEAGRGRFALPARGGDDSRSCPPGPG